MAISTGNNGLSTIDLLATLFKGQLEPTSTNARDYMQKFMKNNHIPYTQYEVKLLKIYRHKFVHVAQPKPLIEIGADRITWRYDNVDSSNGDIIRNKIFFS